MVDYGTVSIVLTGIGLIIALTYYSLQIRNQNKTRQAQMLVQIYNKFTDVDFLDNYYTSMNLKPTNFEDYLETITSLRENNTRGYAELISVGTTLEGMGVLVRRGFIDSQYVADTYGTLILQYWEQKGPFYKELRERWGNPRIYREMEYLYDVVSEIVYREDPDTRSREDPDTRSRA